MCSRLFSGGYPDPGPTLNRSWDRRHFERRPRSFRMKSRVLVRRADRNDPRPQVRELMEGCQWRECIAEHASVVIKPNLCTERPEQIHTANTSISVLRAVCEILLERTSKITIVESDGSRYPAEAAFENNGVNALAAELGLKVLNLS